jgi:hypothetical protein
MSKNLPLLFCTLSVGFGCATVALYEVPPDHTDFATIQENDPPTFDLFDRQYVRIHSIDRKLINRLGGQPVAEIRPLDAAHAILRLNAAPGVHYLLEGDIHRKQDYADFWVEDLATRTRIIPAVRVSGFPESH